MGIFHILLVFACIVPCGCVLSEPQFSGCDRPAAVAYACLKMRASIRFLDLGAPQSVCAHTFCWRGGELNGCRQAEAGAARSRWMSPIAQWGTLGWEWLGYYEHSVCREKEKTRTFKSSALKL